MKHIFLAFLLLWSGSGYLAAQTDQLRTITGYVFADRNANGLKERGEKGLRNVAVSNGRDIVYTDRHGSFVITARSGQSVFPILPAGYMVQPVEKAPVANAAFFYVDPELAFSDTTIGFGLAVQQQKKHFRVGAIGDIQTGSRQEISYAGRSIIPELTARTDIDFHIFLGDIFNDDLSLIPEMNALLKPVPAPVWLLPGNHDRNTAHQQHMEDLFNRSYGAGTFAFNYADVHFLIFDNIFPTGARSYEGRYSGDQMLFLERSLQHLPDDKLVVISQHIPMAHTKDQQEILAHLKRFRKVLILSGHMHRVGRYFYHDGRVQEVVAGATCGSWWRGEKDQYGVPQALMQCGSPRNYFTVDFRPGDYTINFKAVGHDSRYQMDITADSARVIANIFGGSDATEVWMRINDGPQVKMEQTAMIAPNVLSVVEKNRNKEYPTSGNLINPLRRRNSPHIWMARLTPEPGARTYKIHITAKDRYGFEAESTIVVAVE